MTTSANLSSCRMYEAKYPKVDQVVMVQVKTIAEMGAYVSLLEYNNIEGMILLSELSRKRIRSINKLIRVGRNECVVVMRVDEEKGYIDLSKRRVSPEDIASCEEKYNKSKAVHSIMSHIAVTCQMDLEELYNKFAWPVYRKYGHAYDAFKSAIEEPSILDPFTADLSPQVKESLLVNIQRRLTPQPVKLRADMEVTCFQYEGVDAIKAALLKGIEAGSEKIPIKIKLVAPPLYVMVTTATDKQAGINQMNSALEVIREEIHNRKGELIIKMAPRVVSEREDTSFMEENED